MTKSDEVSDEVDCDGWIGALQDFSRLNPQQAKLVFQNRFDAWKHFDNLRWTAPAVVSAFSALITKGWIDLRNEPTQILAVVLSLFAAALFIATWLQMRLTCYLRRTIWTLRRLEMIMFGNTTIPQPSSHVASAASWFAVLTFVTATLALLGVVQVANSCIALVAVFFLWLVLVVVLGIEIVRQNAEYTSAKEAEGLFVKPISKK